MRSVRSARGGEGRERGWGCTKGVQQPNTGEECVVEQSILVPSMSILHSIFESEREDERSTYVHGLR